MYMYIYIYRYICVNIHVYPSWPLTFKLTFSGVFARVSMTRHVLSGLTMYLVIFVLGDIFKQKHVVSTRD